MARIRPGEVDTFYEERGEGEPLVLLHPGGADARAWAPNLGALAGRFRVLTPSAAITAAPPTSTGRSPRVDGRRLEVDQGSGPR
jgi:pimeloyl-ACP methyl ester carboxylesterase